ncbi:hypothetical protein B484DRAFT_393030 [Ochromonadaceae sp. CCMP2298]|nr:hypothetical protein B484DRAFT_393030 [Ochromonadaceae sp. CCMP2298]
MFMQLLFVLLSLALHCRATPFECPADGSCPYIGDSRCCSLGAGGDGCGECQASSCPGNFLDGCNPHGGPHCEPFVDACVVTYEAACEQQCLGVVSSKAGQTCLAAGALVICQGSSGNCGTANSQICV